LIITTSANADSTATVTLKPTRHLRPRVKLASVIISSAGSRPP